MVKMVKIVFLAVIEVRWGKMVKIVFPYSVVTFQGDPGVMVAMMFHLRKTPTITSVYVQGFIFKIAK